MGVQLCYHPDVVTSKTWQPKRTQDHQTATLKANPKRLAKDEDKYAATSSNRAKKRYRGQGS